jgi:hypothetical protein
MGFFVACWLVACGGSEVGGAPCAKADAAPSAPAAVSASARAAAVLDAKWGRLGDLVGAWDAVDDVAGSHGTALFTAELGGQVLVRRGTNETKEGHHEDLTVIRRTGDGGFRADYTDNEGHYIA